MFKIVESIERGDFDPKLGKCPEVKMPVIINTDRIKYVMQCYDNDERCTIQFSDSPPILVEGTLYRVLERLNCDDDIL